MLSVFKNLFSKTESTSEEAPTSTPEQITLIKASFAKVVPISETAAALFYARLFELDPSLKPMFPEDLTEQGVKLMKMIGTAVSKLTKLDELVPALEDLAVRHNDYGVEESHYATVGQALIDTLAKGLGDDFTEEARAAWTGVYGLVASTMRRAANQMPAAAA